MKPSSRARRSQPLRPLELDTFPQNTTWKSHGQQVKLEVMDALTDMSGVHHLSTAEIDAVVGLLMLHRHTPGPCRFSPSPSVQTTGHEKRTASRVVKSQATTTVRERPRTSALLDIQGKGGASPISQDPGGRSSSHTLTRSGLGPGTDQSNTTQNQAENTQVSSASSIASRSYHGQISKPGHPKGNKLYPQSQVAKKRKCPPNSSQPPQLANTPLSSTEKVNILEEASSTNTTPQETEHTTNTTLRHQLSTNQQTPTSPNKPTLILPAAPTPQHQGQSKTEPQSPPAGCQSQPQHLPQPHLKIATPAPTSTAPTKPPQKKSKKYGTAYEVSRARQIQATGVPRLPGPCHSCARRQRQLDEVAAVVSGRVTGTDTGGGMGMGTVARVGIGRFARRQRGDEFLPCIVLSNGNGNGDGNGDGTGDGTGPTPCARCKSIKMKCEG